MQLWTHQREALDQLGPRSIYGDAAGSGKTLTSVMWAAQGGLTGNPRVLVLASGDTILDQWTQTVRDAGFVGHFVKGYGTKPKRAAARAELRDDRRATGLVLNYEALRFDIAELLTLGFDTIICDEAHHLKGRRNAVYFAVEKLARRAERILHVTGTPILNHAEEAWSLLHLIDPRTYSSFWRWARAHFDIEVTDFHGKAPRPIRLVRDLKPGQDEVLRAQLAPYLVQRDFDTLFPDAPPVSITEVGIDLGPAERAMYDELVRRSWTQVGDELLLTENAVAKVTRLRQLTSSWATLMSDPEHPGAKIEAARKIDAAKVGDEQVLLLSAYQDTAMRLAHEVPGAEYMHGKTRKRERDQILDRFKRGETRALSATIGVLGEGVDGLQVCRNLIQLDRDWTPARNDQVLHRVRRGGQEREVRAWYLIGNNTIDQAVSTALTHKTAIIESLV